MTRAEWKAWYEKQIEFHKAEYAWNTAQIEYTNEELAKLREEHKYNIETLWAKGVLTEIDMWYVTEFDIKNSKEYKGKVAWRATRYTQRKRDEKWIAEYTEELKKYEND